MDSRSTPAADGALRPSVAEELLTVLDADPGQLTILTDDRGTVRWAGAAGLRTLLAMAPDELVGVPLGVLGPDLAEELLTPSVRGLSRLVTVPSAPGRPAVPLLGRTTSTSSGGAVIRLSAPRRGEHPSMGSAAGRSRDALTGLLGPAEIDPLRGELERSEDWLVMLVELDRFDDVVERVGPGGADAVLRTIAARLQAFFREGDLVVRTGWREFAVVVRSNGGPGWPEAMAERLLLAIGGPISSDDGFVSVAASIGILSSEDHVPGADPFVVAHTGMERSRFDGGARWTRCLPRTAS